MIFSYLPILVVDVLGSLCMIFLSVISLNRAKQLRRIAPDNTIFLYLVWICSGLAVFAVSRGFGHIVKQVMLMSGNGAVWSVLSPYSGTVNTVSFMLVGLITLFFNQSWSINLKVFSSQKALEEAHMKLVGMNQTLEQKVVERTEMLTTSEHKCRRIFEKSLDTILVTDSRWNILEINPSGETMIGYKKHDMILESMSMDKLFASESEWERISALIFDNEYILNEETYFRHADGAELLVLITGGIDYGAFGCEQSFYFIIKNINEKKEMEQQIAQADKLAALGELSAGVAHEINNPLGVILGYTQLMLKTESSEDSRYYEDLKIIEKHVKNCKLVVADLLAFSRNDSFQQGIVDLNAIVDEVVRFMRNHADFRNVEIEATLFDQGALKVMGNEQEFRQVVLNLVINACHAVDRNSKIQLTTGQNAGGDNFIRVKDNGEGIAKENLAKIFNPFFTTKPVGQGTGLGLSVSYGIIKKYGGMIRVESVEHEGALFTITLPRAKTQGDGK